VGVTVGSKKVKGVGLAIANAGGVLDGVAEGVGLGKNTMRA
jgi:hypothetical protein